LVKDCEPLVALAPLHPPDAVQVVALVEDQVSKVLPPLVTEVGEAVIVTVGEGARVVMPTLLDARETLAAGVNCLDGVGVEGGGGETRVAVAVGGREMRPACRCGRPGSRSRRRCRYLPST